jgi:hypothetical protein
MPTEYGFLYQISKKKQPSCIHKRNAKTSASQFIFLGDEVTSLKLHGKAIDMVGGKDW